MKRKLLIGAASLEDLLDRLAFTEEQTAMAAMEQPKLYMAAADYRVRKMRKRQEAEMALDNIRVDIAMMFRKKFKGEKGVTEKFLNERVEKHSEVRKAEVEAAKAKRLEEWAKHLMEAYEHRRTSLKILTQFAFMDDTFVVGKTEVERMASKRERLRKLRNTEDEEL